MKPVTIPNIFAGQSGNVAVSQVDTDYTTLATAINDPATYAVYAADTGVANAYLISLNPAPSSLASLIGVPIVFKATAANTGTSTINVNALGVININDSKGNPILSSAIAAGGLNLIVYDGINFQLVTTPSANLPTAGYSRVTPNMCRKNNILNIYLTRDVITQVVGPAGCKGLILLLDAYANSANSVGSRFSEIDVYSDATMANLLAKTVAQTQELTPTSGVILSRSTQEVHVKTDNTGSVWLLFGDDLGNLGAGNYWIAGYYD